MKLKYKFFIIFFLISNIPLLAISYFSYSHYTSLIRSQLNQVSRHLVDNAVQSVNTSIEEINHITEIFSFYSTSYDSIVENLKKYTGKQNYTDYDVFESNKNIKFICQNLIYSKDYINGIFVFTPSGETLGYGYGGSIDVHPEYTPEQDEWYQNTLKSSGQIYIDGPSTKEYLITASTSVTFCRALYDVYTHEFLGVLVIDCSPKVFDLQGVNTMPKNVMLSIEGDSNQILYSNVDDLPYNFSNASTMILKENLTLEPLLLTAAINYDALYKEFGASRIIIVAFAFICAVIFLFISFVLSRNITQPIAYLSGCMHRHKSNDYITEPKFLNRTDEIGILFNEYNSMLYEINSYFKKEFQSKLILLDSQMKALESQINSHFLYNTLEAINSIAAIEGVKKISIMSLALGNMFRYSIKTQSELVPVLDELKHVNDYVAIQQIRFSNRFSLETEIADHLLDHRILKLILQPIIENALYHGLNYCSTGDTIKIKGFTKENLLYLSVTDNGCGMDDTTIDSLKQSLSEPAQFTELGHRNKQSIGLKNIHSRITLYYGQAYGLSISSVLNEGTTITIQLPLLKEV